MNPTRRSFMSLFAVAPLALVAAPALALETTASPSAAMPMPTGGLWTTLVHATDGTDPSTSITTELPRFTPEIRKLAGTQVTLEGYLQPVGVGFGRSEYVMGRLPFHCAFCYTQGRASLALVRTAAPLPESVLTQKVKLRGTLLLQEERPDDFYYHLTGAQLA